MSEPLDELYFKWLYSQVSDPDVKSPVRTYWFLLRQAFRKEFVWFIPNDDNRIIDGQELRYEFISEHRMNVPEEWLNLGCSMLEMMIGLSRRISFDTDGDPRDWFWKMMTNLRIAEFNDRNYNAGEFSEMAVDGVMEKVIWRTYDRNGRGGLFPLNKTRRDQRNVEIWYQMNEYLQQN